MTDSDPAGENAKKPFYEQNPFRGLVAAVGLLTAIWAFTGLDTPSRIVSKATEAQPLPLKNTMIVLDTSARMNERFGRVTKYDIAATAAAQWAVSGEDAGLALRAAGGACGREPEPLVDFGKGNSDEVRQAAFEQEPAGKSNFAAAVRTAISEFSDARFKQSGAENQILVFLGGEDECGLVPGEEIRDELEDSNVKTVFRFFALKVSKKTKRSLEAMERQLEPKARVEVREANTLRQVYQAVREVKSEEAEEAAEPGGTAEQLQRELAEPALPAEEEPGPATAGAPEEEGEGEPGEEAEVEPGARAEGEGDAAGAPEEAEKAEEAPSEAEPVQPPEPSEPARPEEPEAPLPRAEEAPLPKKDLSSIPG